MMTVVSNKYRLKDGSIYWHKLYYDNVPRFMTRYSPPFGSYNYAYYLYHPHQYIMELVDEVRYFLQRGQRGWSDRDAWGWFYHHAEVMVGVIKHLRKHTHGYPIGLTPSKWNRKLAVMEQGFQAAIDEENDYSSYKLPDYHKLIFKRRRKLMLGLKYFRQYYYNLWD